MGVGLVVLVVYHRKIRPTQLWVELSWVVAKRTLKLYIIPPAAAVAYTHTIFVVLKSHLTRK